jgi:hypothetical protein
MAISKEQLTTQVSLPLSKWCLWLGISSLIFGIFTGLPAIVCGHIASSKLRQPSNIYTGKRLILAGLVLGYFSVIFSVAFFGLFIYSEYPIASILG